MLDIIISMGIPSGITGLFFWYLKKYIDKQENERKKREEATHSLMLYIMKTSRATNVLAEATARAVQRIPDAHCNGDMTSALETAKEIQAQELNFLVDQGIKNIFE